MKDTDHKKRGYRSENKLSWVQIREGVGTDRRTYVIVGTDVRIGERRLLSVRIRERE